ncbi:MAG: GNAT family N-acetyltransferase [Planctomycetota bacterium]|nr:GNAT family N-acetyltransferase [Planctomycetota bacterium]
MATQPTRPDAIRYRRAAGEQDELAFVRILERSFAIPADAARVAWSRLGADVRVLEDAGLAVACLGWYAFGQWFGGRSIPCAGIAAVGVEPHRRGAGLATRIVADALRELAAAGTPLAALYPSNLALYRRADFEISGGRYELRAACAGLPRSKSLESVVPLPDGVRDPRVRRLYAQVAARNNGWIDRNEALWDRVRDFRGELREGFGVERAGELAGFVFLARRKRREWGFDLACGDFVATDGRAGRALLSFLSGHGTIAVEVHAFVAPWDPLVGLLDDVSERHVLHHPWMLRVLDVRAALAARGYPLEVRGEVHLDITDDLLPGNAGRHVLTVEGGRARMTNGGSGSVRVRARALGPWLSGFATAESLAFAGLIDGPAGELASLSAFVAGPPPSMPDFF